MSAVTLVDVASTASAQSSPRSLQFKILSLPDPANDDLDTSPSMRDYMLVSSTQPPRICAAGNIIASSSKWRPCDIHEIQAALPHAGKYASYFVGSRVVSNPALHVATRVDPLFFALAHFHRTMRRNSGREGAGRNLEKWQPWDQVLGDLPPYILRALHLDPHLNIDGIHGVGQLVHLLDSSDMCGDDLVLCKFSEERALMWLVSKFERAVEGLRRRLHEKKRRETVRDKELSSMHGGSGAFSSSFTLEEENPKSAIDHEEKKNSGGNNSADSALSREEEKNIRVSGLQLICDYIPTEWKSKLSKEVNLTDEDWIGKKKNVKHSSSSNGEESATSGGKRSRSSLEGTIGQEDVDALLQYTVGSGGKSSSSVITPSNKLKEARNAQSVGLKRLAKVNTKGMKSLTTFFGASKKKTK